MPTDDLASHVAFNMRDLLDSGAPHILLYCAHKKNSFLSQAANRAAIRRDHPIRCSQACRQASSLALGAPGLRLRVCPILKIPRASPTPLRG